jgi:ribosomal RNA-processing protein 12
VQNELLATTIVFLASNNREIVKSALGFVKLSVITLPASIVRPHFPQLVPGLLGWSHDHKNHFKVKVQHIFERMGRRFGWDSVMQFAGDENEDGRKVLENIKKRKGRAKKQKATVAAARDKEDENALSEACTTSQSVPKGILLIFRVSVAQDDAVPKANTGNAFEDVLYGSDSDAEEDHSDAEDLRTTSKQKSSGGKGRTLAGNQKAAQQRGKNNATNRSETRIRTDDNEPMDLLHAGAADAVGS